MADDRTALDTATVDPAVTVDELRAKLTEKLGELHRRATTATEVLSPLTYWRDPLVRFGVGVAIGFVLAGPRRPTILPAGAVLAPMPAPGLLASIVRAGLMAATSALVTRALAPPTPAPPAAPPGPASPVG